MELWRYVLDHDQRLDLAKTNVGQKWFQGLPEVVTSISAPRTWSRGASEEWVRCVHALRSLASRLKSDQSPRPAQIDPIAADGLANRYLKEMQVSLYDEGAERRELAPSNFRGLRVHSPGSSEKRAHEFTHFLQRVFGSLFSPATAQICRVCGKPLPPTAGGKPSRRESCKACQQKKAWSAKTASEKRTIWKQQYRKHRSVAARTGAATSTNTNGE